jgi:16S rRNA (guanine966-N2)-methyltransferase
MRSATDKPANRLRIIGGEWRSRIVRFADIPGIRPTPDRVRETLFNWLQEGVAGARCLDLFAGSGALAFEALSRGAESVVAVETDSKAIAAIREAARELHAQGLCLEHADALVWLRHNREGKRFDIVFLDPPFAENLHANCLALLVEHQWLTPDARIYVESGTSLDGVALPQGWALVRNKRAGAVYYGLIQPLL